jgi:glycosyltransferase involved in cell wall biosynthesis
MRIAIFSESYEPIVNGVSVCVATLRDELSKRGHEVFVFAPAYKGFVDGRDDVFRFPSRHTVLMPDYPFPIPYAPELFRKFKSLRPDIVHTQTPFLLGIVGRKWARQCGVPVVSTNHTLYTEYAHYMPIIPKFVTKGALILLMRWYYSRCNAVVVPSEMVKNILMSYGVKAPIRVIKTGVVPSKQLDPESRSEVRRRFGVSEKGFLLLYVGRIAREKNLAMLLKAFAEVLKSFPNTRLVLVGGGPAMNETKELARQLGVSSALEFAGMLDRERIDPIYSAADVFVFPSITETQGIAICEAMSAGLPVVAANAGGIPENVRSDVDGFLTPNDPHLFADRIRFLLSHPEKRVEMGASARKNASCFSVDRMISDFENFYNSVIESAKSCTF